MQGPYLRRYGVASNVNFVLYGTSGKAFQAGASFATDDVMIMKDNGAEAASATGFADEGQGYSLPISSSEMTGQRIVIYVVDQGTKIWLDTNLVIETYGHPSAMHGFNLDSTTVDVGLILGTSSEIGKLITVSTLLADLNDISTTDILTQTSAALNGSTVLYQIVVDTSEIQGKLPTSNIAGSSELADVYTEVTGLNDLSTTDIVTQTSAVLNNSTMIYQIIVDTSEIQGKLPISDIGGSTELTDINGLISGLNNNSSTDILTQSNAALVALDLDHLIKVDKAGVAPTSGSITDLIMNKSTDQTFDQANDSLEAIRDSGAAGISSTDVYTQTNAVMVALDLDHVVKVDKAGVDPTSGSLFDLIMNKSTDQTFSQANDSLEAIRDRGDASWTGSVSTSDMYDSALNAVNDSTMIFQIVVDTSEIQGKLPVTDIAGSSELSDVYTEVTGLNNISTTDILTQTSAALSGSTILYQIVVDTSEIQGKLPVTNIAGSSELADIYTEVTGLNNISTTDVLTQTSAALNGSTVLYQIVVDTSEIQGKLPVSNISGSSETSDIYSVVSGLNDISTTDIITQVNLSDASTFDPSVDTIDGTVIWNKVMLDMSAESHFDSYKSGNVYKYHDSTGGYLFSLTVSTSDRARSS